MTVPSEVDVLVIGFGAAGATAAITAHDAGASVAVVEKTSSGGGNCLHSGGFLFELDGPRAVDHLDALCFGKTDRGVLEAYARGLPDVADFLGSLGGTAAPVEIAAFGGMLPSWPHFPGAGHAHYRQFVPSPGERPGLGLWRVLEAAVRGRYIPVAHDTRAVDLVLDGDRIAGAIVEHDGERRQIGARAGVILASGSFEADPELRDAYLPLPLVSVGHQGNTGDTLDLARAAGASLWHMSAFFGWLSFVHPDYPAAFTLDVHAPSFIYLDGGGQRRPGRRVRPLGGDARAAQRAAVRDSDDAGCGDRLGRSETGRSGAGPPRRRSADRRAIRRRRRRFDLGTSDRARRRADRRDRVWDDRGPRVRDRCRHRGRERALAIKPRVTQGEAMSQTTVDVTTPRGTMPTYVHRPDGDGPFPRVVLFMDAPGIRPALFGHAERLAGAGYTAILPDLYYPFDPADRPNAERMAAGDPEEFARMRKLVEQIHDDDVLEDIRLLLEAVPEGGDRSWACIGFCMGGRIGMRAAEAFGTDVAAASLLHPTGLVTDEPDSPHLEVDRVDAALYLGFGENDQVTPLSTIPPLREQLDQAGVAYEIEILPGADHGFTMPGRAAYDETAAERVWAGTLTLLGSRL